MPIMWWQRVCRSEDGRRLDKLHALALHIFRTAHKTSSAQISLMHLISIFGTHPELRTHLRGRAFVSTLGNIGSSVGCDRSLEMQNDDQKARNTGHSVLNALHFGRLMQAMSWVTRRWRCVVGRSAAVDPGYRTSIVQEVEVLVALFLREVPTNLQVRTTVNTLWHTGRPRNMYAPGSLRECRPHEWIWAVCRGTSRGKLETRLEDFGRWFHRHIREHMFSM